MYTVRQLRTEKGWNQNELAFYADLAPSVISQIETGKREPSATTLRKLSDALGVAVPDLFEREDSPKAPAPPSPPPDKEDEERRKRGARFERMTDEEKRAAQDRFDAFQESLDKGGVWGAIEALQEELDRLREAADEGDEAAVERIREAARALLAA